MEINNTAFGSVTIDNMAYPHDVWIFVDEHIEKRDRNHDFSMEELKIIGKEKPDVIVIGTGQSGVMDVGEEVKEAAKHKGIELVIAETPEAIEKYNKLSKEKRTAAAIHVTC
ncbi:hypothetical protein KY339_01965 [Candidatus Woesearchaeota archaeon]|nr:hypothetical protein [Candidatus Woesearchaeota archaeon]